jgi:hypothetical protein
LSKSGMNGNNLQGVSHEHFRYVEGSVFAKGYRVARVSLWHF